MKIHTRIVILISMLVLLFISGLFVHREFERQRLLKMFDAEKAEKIDLFNKLVTLQGQSLETFAFDYTFWDEMITFIETGNNEWAHTTIDQSISTYHAEAVWILNEKLVLLHTCLVTPGNQASGFPIPLPEVNKLFTHSRFCHFFITTPDGLMEIRGATVHPTKDKERKTKPRGYFFAGSLWDESYLNSLSKLTGATIAIKNPGVQDIFPNDPLNGSIGFSQFLPSWNGAPLRCMNVQMKSDELRYFSQQARWFFAVILGFFAFMIIITSLCLTSWVSRPIIAISRTLTTEDPAALSWLTRKKNEFGDIARLIQQFFQQKSFLEQCSSAKSDFLANTSHEIRTPLNTILGFCELVLNEKSIIRIKKYTCSIMTESEALLKLINALLDMSRIEAGKFTVESVPFDLCLALENIRSSMNVRAARKGLSFTLAIDEKTPEWVQGDPMKFRQVFVNLIDNAIKFTSSGSVDVLVKPVQESSEDFLLHAEIRDTGIGIPEEKQAIIFESFTQADGSTIRQYGGSGLGTTIAKAFVEMMGGSIGVKSTPGNGTTFWFTMNLVKLHSPRMGHAGSSRERIPGTEQVRRKNAGETKTILLVEDYEPNRAIAHAHLKGAGYKVDIAINGEEALLSAMEKEYDAILMDVQMPVMDGYEATSRIRRESALNEYTPVLGITANAYRKDLDSCFASGMSDVITKPFRKEGFLSFVGHWTGRKHLPRLPAKSRCVQSGKRKVRLSGSPMNYAQALREFDMDESSLLAVILDFNSQCRQQVELLEEAIHASDTEVIRSEAHKIKGGAGNLCASPLQGAAKKLEEAAISGSMYRVEKAYQRLRKRLLLFSAYCASLSNTEESALAAAKAP